MNAEKLQGTWRNGAATITLMGDRFTTAQMGAEYSGYVEFNEGAAPKTLAPHFETGPEAGNSNHGIYEFVGEEWRFCLNMTGEFCGGVAGRMDHGELRPRGRRDARVICQARKAHDGGHAVYALFRPPATDVEDS